jgi:outer membrane lipoprotein-sorting protein
VGTFLARRSGAVALAAVFSLAVSGLAARQATVDDIIQKNLEARGGLARLRLITSIKQTGTLTMMGNEATLTIYSKRPNLLRQEMTVSGKQVINGFDGLTPWIINPLMGADRPILVSGPQADMIREQSEFDGPLVDYKAHGVAISVEGLEMAAEDQGLLHLKLTSPSKQVRHLYLDSVTYLDAKLMTEQQQMKLEQVFSDYRDVDGVKVPFMIRTLTNGIQQSEIKLTEVAFNVKMDDAMFRVPKGS